ncbi:hypothetical protein [Endozoicomonas arenosclerae]|uniref:hypothetical protein n=1 Tax=Endozoicomonas arenosclerae TaxID=1633495 RepID=UPI000781BF32|nr:hypothetical protein [Endozoicomonas arenosclerae]
MKTPKYPIQPALQKVIQHSRLPVDSVELGRMRNISRANILHILVKRSDRWLSILSVRGDDPLLGKKYRCYQDDFPLGFLSWFPKALEDFRKPPAEGGLHAGAMSSIDYDIEGEMLCVQRTVEGYEVLNRSRNASLGTLYRPVSIEFTENFLYQEGLLNLIQKLGDQYDKGLI